MKKCIYCNQIKAIEEFTKEHILPRAIGGAIEPTNPLVTYEVCTSCNTNCGYFIDNPFVKSFFINISQSSQAKMFINLDEKPILPLEYMGELDNLKYKEKICDYWIGPAGDSIYHFHVPWPQVKDLGPTAGLHPLFKKSKKIDNGFVFLFIASNNPIWYPTIFRSFINQFENTVLYLGNGLTPKVAGFSDIPRELENLHRQILSLARTEHKLTVKVGIDTGARFLGKLALGMAALNLDRSFIESDGAKILREQMWTKKLIDRQKLSIQGTGFFNPNSNDEFKDMFTWKGGHVIALVNIPNLIGLHVNFYDSHIASIVVSDNNSYWIDKFNEGIVYVIVPGLRKACRISLPRFLFHRYKIGTCPELENLEKEMSKYDTLPPFMLNNVK